MSVRVAEWFMVRAPDSLLKGGGSGSADPGGTPGVAAGRRQRPGDTTRVIRCTGVAEII